MVYSRHSLQLLSRRLKHALLRLRSWYYAVQHAVRQSGGAIDSAKAIEIKADFVTTLCRQNDDRHDDLNVPCLTLAVPASEQLLPS